MYTINRITSVSYNYSMHLYILLKQQSSMRHLIKYFDEVFIPMSCPPVII